MDRRQSAKSADFLVREPPELHALGCFVHGALAALHALGAVYNCRRRNWWDVAAHVAAAIYDARSVRHHYRTEQIARRRALAAATHGPRSTHAREAAEFTPRPLYGVGAVRETLHGDAKYAAMATD